MMSRPLVNRSIILLTNNQLGSSIACYNHGLLELLSAFESRTYTLLVIILAIPCELPKDFSQRDRAGSKATARMLPAGSSTKSTSTQSKSVIACTGIIVKTKSSKPAPDSAS